MQSVSIYMQRLTGLFVCLTLVLISCEEFVQIEPPTNKISNEIVFNNEETIDAAITGMYHQMLLSGGFASGYLSSVTISAGYSADELVEFSDFPNDQVEFYQNEITVINVSNQGLWSSAYNSIYHANSIIEGLQGAVGLSNEVKFQAEGEAKFIRAFAHFYLLNLYGDIPLITSTDYRINALSPRTPKVDIYSQIVADLLDAQNLLSDTYVVGDRIRPNKSAATALLSRVYLFLEDWVNAEQQATSVIDNTNLYALNAELNEVFLANSSEAIWQLAPVGQGHTNEGLLFILVNRPYYPSPALSTELISTFEDNDERLNKWVGVFSDGTDTYYFPYKYKVQIDYVNSYEYSMVLRLAEQYLIRAEARAKQNKLVGINSAESDLNIIRNRAGLPSTTASTTEEMLDAIMNERRIELFAEWGHRWLDLKRTEHADQILGAVKSKWQTTDQLYPIPESEILRAVNLDPQNPGY